MQEKFYKKRFSGEKFLYMAATAFCKIDKLFRKGYNIIYCCIKIPCHILGLGGRILNGKENHKYGVSGYQR